MMVHIDNTHEYIVVDNWGQTPVSVLGCPSETSAKRHAEAINAIEQHNAVIYKRVREEDNIVV